jgi:hypothetical protein
LAASSAQGSASNARNCETTEIETLTVFEQKFEFAFPQGYQLIQEIPFSCRGGLQLRQVALVPSGIRNPIMSLMNQGLVGRCPAYLTINDVTIEVFFPGKFAVIREPSGTIVFSPRGEKPLVPLSDGSAPDGR